MSACYYALVADRLGIQLQDFCADFSSAQSAREAVEAAGFTSVQVRSRLGNLPCSAL